MRSPFISVIVPSYNSQATLEKCLESIIVQSFSNFELILVDDGSIDASGALCDLYAGKDPRIKVVHKKNGGVSSARNAGLDIAHGEYVCFADSDDVVAPDWLSNFIKYSSEFPESLIVENVRIEEPDRTYHCYQKSGMIDIATFWSMGNWGYSVNKIYRRSLIEDNAIRFDETIKLYEDELFIARYCSQVNSVFIVDEVGYCYQNTVLLADKFHAELTPSKMIYQYLQIKRYNPLCSHSLVDRLVMSVFSDMKVRNECSLTDVSFLKSAIGKDIKYVCGRKKYLMKMLTMSDSIQIWTFVFSLYLKLNIL